MSLPLPDSGRGACAEQEGGAVEVVTPLFKKWGFKLVKTQPMVFDSFYVSILSEEYKSGEKKFWKGVAIGLISNIIAFFSKRGCSSTIYVFRKENDVK